MKNTTMKTLVLIVSLIALPLVPFAKTRADYIKVMDKFIKYYHAGQADSLNTLGTKGDGFWTKRIVDESLKRQGKVTSYGFMETDSQLAYFYGVSDKKVWGSYVNTISFSLDEDNRIGTIRFFTKSDETDSMLKKYYQQKKR